jgi:hypothetical protein
VTVEAPNFAPNGSEAVAYWATSRRLMYAQYPPQEWFRRWEPFDTMVAAAHYFNAVTQHVRPGSVTVVEPWLEEDASTPIDRTLLAFVEHPGLRWSAAARSGEHFLTRVAFLDRPPQPKVELGDKTWDEHVVTHAASGAEAARAFTPALRALLASRSFEGHLELRPGQAVLHVAGLKPVPACYEELLGAALAVVDAALR